MKKALEDTWMHGLFKKHDGKLSEWDIWCSDYSSSEDETAEGETTAMRQPGSPGRSNDEH